MHIHQSPHPTMPQKEEYVILKWTLSTWFRINSNDHIQMLRTKSQIIMLNIPHFHFLEMFRITTECTVRCGSLCSYICERKQGQLCMWRHQKSNCCLQSKSLKTRIPGPYRPFILTLAEDWLALITNFMASFQLLKHWSYLIWTWDSPNWNFGQRHWTTE